MEKFCYVLLKTHKNTLGIVKYGETGYYQTNYPEGYTQEVVDELNSDLGLTKKESEAMIICSMNSTLNTYEKWDSHYKKIVNNLL